jgi:hypothetical protein
MHSELRLGQSYQKAKRWAYHSEQNYLWVPRSALR